MHLLAAQPGMVTDGSEAVDLGQQPGDVVILSAADLSWPALPGHKGVWWMHSAIKPLLASGKLAAAWP